MAKTGKVSFRSIALNITGISTPVFGVSWNPPADKRKVAQRLIAFLEDRRALYQPYHLEHGPWVTDSILEIRRELTDLLQTAPQDDTLVEPLRAMRAACRKYLDAVDPHTHRIGHAYHGELFFASALGELRGVFGLHLARICVAFGVDVEPELASMFPTADKENKKERARETP